MNVDDRPVVRGRSLAIEQRDEHDEGPEDRATTNGDEVGLAPADELDKSERRVTERERRQDPESERQRGWLARGGTYVVANIRGGGEYGPTWHTSALGEHRHRAYEDFAAVARDLV